MLFLQLGEFRLCGLPLLLGDLVLVDYRGCGLEVIGFGLFSGVILAVLLP
jgi:hypothetical protein